MNRRRNPDELSADSLESRLALAAIAPGGIVALTALEIADAVDDGLIDEAASFLLQPESHENPSWLLDHRKSLSTSPPGADGIVRGPFVNVGGGSPVGEILQRGKGDRWLVRVNNFGEDVWGWVSKSDLTRNSQNPTSHGRRNPEDSASLAYEIFHGKPPKGYTEVIEEIHEHEHLWVLGSLEKLVINTPSGYEATWDFIGNDKPLLCGNEPEPGSTGLFHTNMVCTQLYVRGGDQTLTLDKCKMGKETTWWKEEMVIGELVEVTYHTEKGFDKFRPVDYYHALGEEGGEMPVVVYDTRNRLLSIAGGQYEIKAEGVIN